MLDLEPVQPLRLALRRLRGPLLGQDEAIRRVRPARGMVLPAGCQALLAVLPDRAEHDEARLRRPFDLLQQALVHDGRHPVENVHAQISARVADGLRGFQRASPDEDGKPAEETLLRLVQEAVAPVHRGAQRLLPFGKVPRATGEQLQAAFQAGPHRRRGEQLDAGRGELDRQRQAVQTVADLGDGGRVFLRQLEIGFHGHGPLEEERDRRSARQLLEGGDASGGQTERGDRELMLPVDVQRGAAGHEDLQRRSRGEQLGDDPGRGGQVLEVVEQQEHRRAARLLQPPLDRGQQRLTGDVAHGETLGDRHREHGRIAQRRERDEGHAARKLLQQTLGDLESEAGLPDAARGP